MHRIYYTSNTNKKSILLFCKSFQIASPSVTYLHHKNLLKKSYTNNLITD